jgi:hypothetical protein
VTLKDGVWRWACDTMVVAEVVSWEHFILASMY